MPMVDTLGVRNLRPFIQAALDEMRQQLVGYVPRLLLRADNEDSSVELYRSWLLGVHGHGETVCRDIDLKHGSAVVLGDAGSGKTWILRRALVEAMTSWLEDEHNRLPIYVDLGAELPPNGMLGPVLQQKLAEYPSPRYQLFLDSLDEAIRQFHRPVVNGILLALREVQERLEGVVVACRRWAWEPDFSEKVTLSRDTPVWRADFLQPDAFEHVLPDPNVRRDFLQAVNELGVEDLVSRPIEGFYLARLFAEQKPLPRSRFELFARRISSYLEEQCGQPYRPVRRLEQIARLLAAVATFGEASSSWTEQEAVEALSASEGVVGRLGDVSQDVRALLQCPLFAKLGEKFRFAHDLFREYLAARALEALPLRKQRLLLESSTVLPGKIDPRHRGVAAFLANCSPSFGTYLYESDVLTAFVSEGSASPDVEEELLGRFLAWALDAGIYPWWEVPPRGERLRRFLRHHRPSDPARFLMPYLHDSRPLARLWAAFAADSWGGNPALNPSLCNLALDPKEKRETRAAAVKAIALTGERDWFGRMEGLRFDVDDEVRGVYIRSYRELLNPEPPEFIQMLFGGAHEPNFFSVLKAEALFYGRFLNESQLRSAMRFVVEHRSDLANLWDDMVTGLLERAWELRLADVPPDLLVWGLVEQTLPSRRRAVEDILRQFPEATSRCWRALVSISARAGAEAPGTIQPWEAQEDLHRLVDLLQDGVIDLVRQNPPASSVERDVVRSMLQYLLSLHPTTEMLAALHSSLPHLTQGLVLPTPRRSRREPSATEIKASTVEILNLSSSAIEAAYRLIESAVRLSGRRSWVPTLGDDEAIASMEWLLSKVPPYIRARVLHVFREVVEATAYEGREVAPKRLQVTHPWLEVPFLISIRHNVSFPDEKRAEVARAYAFLRDFAKDPYVPMLEDIRKTNPELWRRTLLDILNHGPYSLHRPLEYVASLAEEADLYVEGARRRLGSLDFDRVELAALLTYWKARRPSDYCKVLRKLYLTLRKASSRHIKGRTANPRWDTEDLKYMQAQAPIELLLLLLESDDDWAWAELARLLDSGIIPHIDLGSSVSLPSNPARLPIVADWYFGVLRKAEHDGFSTDETRWYLRRVIEGVGGEAALRHLERMRHCEGLHASAKAEIDYLHFRISDQVAASAAPALSTEQVLEQILRSSHFVVHSGRDLFEVVLEALEHVDKQLMEGHGVEGFWNHTGAVRSEPKSEPQCQNVFWAFLAERLERLGIIGVEERVIRKGRADFWCEYPVRDQRPFRVPIELKLVKKGTNVKQLVERMEGQLVREYMEPAGLRYGIYVALWFRCDAYDYPKSVSVDELNALLSQQAAQLRRDYGVRVQPVVVNASAPARQV